MLITTIYSCCVSDLAFQSHIHLDIIGIIILSTIIFSSLCYNIYKLSIQVIHAQDAHLIDKTQAVYSQADAQSACLQFETECTSHIGGAYAPKRYSFALLKSYKPDLHGMYDGTFFYFETMVPIDNIHSKYLVHPYVTAQVPLSIILNESKDTLGAIARIHDISVNHKTPVAAVRSLLELHQPCNTCISTTAVFRVAPIVLSGKDRSATHKRRKIETQSEKLHEINTNMNSDTNMHNLFPPSPPTTSLLTTIINSFCDALQPENVLEEGCAVCGLLSCTKDMTSLQSPNIDLVLLAHNNRNLTRKERFTINDPIEDIDGPVIDSNCNKVCAPCYSKLVKGKIPTNALVLGNWIGDVPNVLKGLSVAEKMMISRVHHNRCIVRVAKSGQHRMRGNAISWSVPMPKVYHALPPTPEEMNEVLAFVYLGPEKPTEDDYKRTPLLVRKKKGQISSRVVKIES